MSSVVSSGISYYQLSRVYPRDELRQPWQRRQRGLIANFLSVVPSGPICVVSFATHVSGIYIEETHIPGIYEDRNYIPGPHSVAKGCDCD